jgi:DNA-directed RNA polymerase specialized sigma24 family protein
MPDWKKYITVASKFQYRARPEDREDLKHDILISLALAEKGNGSRPRKLSENRVIQIARYECQKYWRKLRRRRTGTVSLYNDNPDGDGHRINLIETIPDNEAVDLDRWLDAKAVISRCPKRVLKVAHMILRGEKLHNKEYQLLYRFRHK